MIRHNSQHADTSELLCRKVTYPQLNFIQQ